MFNPPECERVRKAIMNGPEPFVTFKVWDVCRNFVLHNTGQVGLTRAEIAEKAGVGLSAVSRSIGRLATYRAMYRRKRGRDVSYWIDARVGWAGDKSARQVALATVLQAAEEYIAAHPELETPPAA